MCRHANEWIALVIRIAMLGVRDGRGQYAQLWKLAIFYQTASAQTLDGPWLKFACKVYSWGTNHCP